MLPPAALCVGLFVIISGSNVNPFAAQPFVGFFGSSQHGFRRIAHSVLSPGGRTFL